MSTLKNIRLFLNASEICARLLRLQYWIDMSFKTGFLLITLISKLAVMSRFNEKSYWKDWECIKKIQIFHHSLFRISDQMFPS